MTKLLPELQQSQYEVSDSLWTEISSEITRLRGLINSGAELQPNDVKKVQSLAKQVRDYGTIYRREITTQASNYKSLLDNELEQLGYGVIENYVNTKRTEQHNETNQRLNAKLQHFNTIVRGALANTTYLKVSSIAQFVANSLISRFPKLNSGAISKEINNWTPIESVVTNIINEAETLFVSYPVLQQLPASSQSLRAVTKFLETGDSKVVADMNGILQKDRNLIQQLALYPRVETDAMTVNEIENIIKTENIDDATRLARMQIVLNVYWNRKQQN